MLNEKDIDKADSFLTKLWAFLGKHWGKLLIIGLCFLGYKFCVLVGEEIDKEQETPTEQQYEESLPADSSIYYEEPVYDDTTTYEEVSE